jgi:hypothetical protein
VTWWGWTLLWTVLVLGAGFFGFRVGLSLWRKASALLTELGAAADRLSAVSAELETLARAEPEPEPAVFADPAELRRQRYLRSRR